MVPERASIAMVNGKHSVSWKLQKDNLSERYEYKLVKAKPLLLPEFQSLLLSYSYLNHVVDLTGQPKDNAFFSRVFFREGSSFYMVSWPFFKYS